MNKPKTWTKEDIARDAVMMQVLGTLCAKMIAAEVTEFECDLIVGSRKFHFRATETEATDAELENVSEDN